MTLQHALYLTLILPLAGGALCFLPRSPRAVFSLLIITTLAHAFLCGVLGVAVFAAGPIATGSDWLRIDALSALHLLLVAFVFLTSTVFAAGYFAGTHLPPRRIRIFGVLWLGTLGAMTSVLLANHLGLMWVGVETTTLMTTFLIALHRSRESLEAMWKYLMICSVGIAIAFLGMLIFGATASRVAGGGSDALLWTALRDCAAQLDPKLAKLGFIFLLVGYGTKVGLAPMHTWLPDAHSQAPAPVSSIFSAAMLSTVFYCIMRYLPIVEAATGHAGFGSRLLCLFGAISMLIAAAFILFQRDVKRMLAYCSVEHMGIVAIGLGLGSLGTFAAMFHTMNHSLAKTAGFLSAGRLGQMAGSNEMARLRGVFRMSPVWGTGLCLSLLALIGVVPSAVFMSELQIVKAAVDAQSTWSLVAFLLAAGTVFLGMFAHTMGMLRGEPDKAYKPLRPSVVDAVLVALPVVLVMAFGIWMPSPVRQALVDAAAIVRPLP